MFIHSIFLSSTTTPQAYFAQCHTRAYLLHPFDSDLQFGCDARQHWTGHLTVHAVHLALHQHQLRDMLAVAALLTAAQSATLCVFLIAKLLVKVV